MNVKSITQLAAVSTLFAMSATAHAGWQGNFLLGVEGGYATRSAELNISVTEPAAFGSTVATSAMDYDDDDGFVYGFLGGYQWRCDRLVLGLEANVSFQDFGDERNLVFTDSTGVVHAAQVKHERNTVFGLSGRAGYYLADWVMPYVRLGAETSDEGIEFGAESFAPNQGAVTIDDERRAYRFIGGAGLEFPFMENAALRLEYLYSSRGRGAGADASSSSVLAAQNGKLWSVNVKPNQHAGKLAVVWNFY